MWKKILVIVLIVAIAGAGGFGTFHFYRANKNQIQQNQMLMAQNASVQAQLDQIGALTTVYEVMSKTHSGNPIKETDLVEVSVPVSTLSEASITNKSNLIGHYYRVDVNPGTIISADMLMDESNDEKPKFNREITVTALPVSTVAGDYIDLRFILPTGEEYIVFSHKQIKRLYDNTITLFLSEEENAILNSVFADLGNYQGLVACYITKYLEPGNDTDTVAFYPVQHEMENFIRFNPNIDDTTRCINERLRDHIDEVLLVYTDDRNRGFATSFISTLTTQIQSGGGAHAQWIQEHTNEDGELVDDDGMVINGSANDSANSGTSISTDPEALQQQVGEATESLEQSITDLEEIQ